MRHVGYLLAGLLLTWAGPYTGAVAGDEAPEILLAVDKVGKGFEFRNAGTHARLARIELPARPHELVVTPDSKTAYVSIYGDGIYGNNTHPGQQVAVIDLVSRRLVDFIDVSPFFAPHGMSIDAYGMLWLTCDKSSHVLVVDPKARAVIAAIPTVVPGTHWIVGHPGSKKLYGSNKDNAFIFVFDVNSRAISKRIAVPNGVEGIAISPNGRRVYASDHEKAKILVLDTMKDEVVGTVDLQGYPEIPTYEDHEMRLRVSPDGRYLVVSAYKWDRAVLVETADMSKQTLLKTKKGPMGIAFSANSSCAYLAEHDSGSISVIDLARKEFAGSFSCGTGVETMELIPGEDKPCR